MATNELRDAIRSQPLRPFTSRAASGEEIDVPHPEFVAFSRSGRTISVALPTGEFAIIDLLLVESLGFRETDIAADGVRRDWLGRANAS